MEPIFLDFETEAIQPRWISYPPKPVGVSVLDPETGENAYYTGQAMVDRLAAVWASGRRTCWHNSMFDLDVAETHLGLPWPYPQDYDDTLTMAFLRDCHVPQLSLKYLAEKWCGIVPEARDELHEWILANIPEATAKTAGAYICHAPVELVAKYAVDDVRMTKGLRDFCLAAIDQQPEAYLREIALQKVLIDNERLGVRVDRPAMATAITVLEQAIEDCDAWIRTCLKAPDLVVSSGPSLAKALLASDKYDHDAAWPTTKKGAPSTAKDTVASMIKDPALVDMLRYRSYASTILGTFAQPWYEQSEKTGRIYTQWNAVRGERGGTRTGRLSAKPTLQTAPTRYPEMPHLALDLPDLPKVRAWILPDEGDRLVSADFSGQELRLFAHFEGDALAKQYNNDPDADLHQFAAVICTAECGFEVSRRNAKTLAFTIIYGGGSKRVAETAGCTLEQAWSMINAYKNKVAVGLPRMQRILDQRYEAKQPFKTLGGRLVKGEPPCVIDGVYRRFNYKMVNLMIQGSAADQTKQAMINYKGPGRILLSLHDQIVLTVPKDHVEEASKALVDTMLNALPMSVPMRSDLMIGDNFSECK